MILDKSILSSRKMLRGVTRNTFYAQVTLQHKSSVDLRKYMLVTEFGGATSQMVLVISPCFNL